MSLDPRTPVLVGAGQFIQKPADLHDALEPVAMMNAAVEAAASDASVASLPAAAELIVAVKGAWRYSDPARLVAERFGAGRARTAMTTDGGNTPQTLMNAIARRIAAGELDVAGLVGGGGIWSRRRMRAGGNERGGEAEAGGGP